MINMEAQKIDNTLRELVRKDRDVQMAIAKEINVAVVTVYHWATYHPERLARNKAALRIAKRFLKKSGQSQPQP
jgi:hypothetical protein